ncbi:hypothetical protein FN846DRAFT_886539 [Sphaerosporella brunnea]|uniref:Uncharacterized protein n=1 Tax=Sphaerosporella brunnea TaxID=1250544 RepID=A0A5J5F9G0_9PEZI|nr:hypothetical protein FN846DRAFT_886539 [Sphaerosporella brunnea]
MVGFLVAQAWQAPVMQTVRRAGERWVVTTGNRGTATPVEMRGPEPDHQWRSWDATLEGAAHSVCTTSSTGHCCASLGRLFVSRYVWEIKMDHNLGTQIMYYDIIVWGTMSRYTANYNHHIYNRSKSEPPTIDGRAASGDARSVNEFSRRGSYPRSYQGQKAKSYGSVYAAEHYRARKGYTDPNTDPRDHFGAIPPATGHIRHSGFTGKQLQEYTEYKAHKGVASLLRAQYESEVKAAVKETKRAWGDDSKVWAGKIDPPHHQKLIPSAIKSRKAAEIHRDARQEFNENYPITISKGHTTALKDATTVAKKTGEAVIMHQWSSPSQLAYPLRLKHSYPGYMEPMGDYNGMGSTDYTQKHH